MIKSLPLPPIGNDFLQYEKCYIKNMLKNDKAKQICPYLKANTSENSLENLIFVSIYQLNVNIIDPSSTTFHKNSWFFLIFIRSDQIVILS